MINFTKMHGLGNDFIIIDNTKDNINLDKEQIQFLADRHFGVGFDQLLMVETSTKADFKYIIYNADGTEAEQCGNGARCFARFVKEKKLTDKNTIKVETKAGIIEIKIGKDDSVCVNMGRPNFSPQEVGFNIKKTANTYKLAEQEFAVVSMGNPHMVIVTKDIDNLDIKSIAIKMQKNPVFTNSINVGFMQIITKNQIRLRVYERGAGETLACGSGACAAVASGINLGLLDNKVLVKLNGGNATVEKLTNDDLMLCGPAQFVFEGKINNIS